MQPNFTQTPRTDNRQLLIESPLPVEVATEDTFETEINEVQSSKKKNKK
jgi:hypothetical protein